jgi:hypothetical protein
MPPELLVAVLAFDWFARLPLFLGNAFEMAVATGIQAMIGHKHRLDDPYFSIVWMRSVSVGQFKVMPQKDGQQPACIKYDAIGRHIGDKGRGLI